jgi:hypothetical protein
MGYKSVLRSMGAASNRAAKERSRINRARQREIERVNRQLAAYRERLNKKLAAHKEKLTKILQELEDVYAKGKVTKEEYTSLKSRASDIPLEYVIVGKQPFISLAKRYITGKIDKNEFDEVKKSILPSDFNAERENIGTKLKSLLENLEEFKNSCKEAQKGYCQKCGSKRKIFNWVSKYEGFSLCRKCRKLLTAMQLYPAFNGKYFTVDAKWFHLPDLNEKQVLSVNLRESLL